MMDLRYDHLEDSCELLLKTNSVNFSAPTTYEMKTLHFQNKESRIRTSWTPCEKNGHN